MFFPSKWHLSQNRHNIVQGGISLAGTEGHDSFWGRLLSALGLATLHAYSTCRSSSQSPFTLHLSCFYLSELKNRHIWFHGHPYLITRKVMLCLTNNLSLSFLSDIYNISLMKFDGFLSCLPLKDTFLRKGDCNYVFSVTFLTSMVLSLRSLFLIL